MADEVNKQQLLAVISRVERLEEEIKALTEDKKSVFDEGKEKGLDPKYVRKVIALKKQDPEKRRIEEAELEVYKQAAGVE
jgi:uncharacterized protein (UPF0335 family)